MDPKTGPAVVIVGISSKLGTALAAELASRGARVSGTYFRGEAAASVAPITRRLDLTCGADIGRVLGELSAQQGGIDALVHCATLVSAATSPTFDRLADLDEAALTRMLAVNVASPLLCAKALATLPPASPDRPRNLVFVGSIDGIKPVPTAASYATTKGALVASARALAKELGPRNFLVNVVAPGILENGATSVVPDDVRREYLKHSGLKRYGRHEEVAKTIAWLVTKNTYVTGQAIALDGGL